MEGKATFVEVSTDSLRTAVDVASISNKLLNYAHNHPAVGLIGSKFYIFGSTSDKVEVYDPETDIVTLTASTPLYNTGFANAVTYNNFIYIFGSNSSNYVNAVCKYDPSTDVFTRLTSCSYGPGRSAVVRFGSLAYILGGISSGTATNYVRAYDLETGTDTILLTNAFPTTLYQMGFAIVGKQIYTFGGVISSLSYSGKIYKYSIDENTITDLGYLPTAGGFRDGMGYAATVINNKVYIFGGANSSIYRNSIIEFDPSTETCTVMDTTLPKTIVNATACEYNDTAYIFGSGSAAEATGKEIQLYTPKAHLAKDRLKLFATTYISKSGQVVTNIIDGNGILIKMFMTSAFIGDDDGYAKAQDAYVYDSTQQQWISLDGNPYTA